jgi:cation transport regulator ChaC
LRPAAVLVSEGMALHFAYGSNMSRALMGSRCPGARALGIATLSGWRFVINPEGFGSIAVQAGGRVLGVVWRLGARDLVAINAYESVATGLYRRRQLPVQWCSQQRADRQRTTSALVYIASRQGEGIPRPGYIALVADAARDWKLPEPYIRTLTRWSRSRWRGARPRDTGELG